MAGKLTPARLSTEATWCLLRASVNMVGVVVKECKAYRWPTRKRSSAGRAWKLQLAHGRATKLGLHVKTVDLRSGRNNFIPPTHL